MLFHNPCIQHNILHINTRNIPIEIVEDASIPDEIHITILEENYFEGEMCYLIGSSLSLVGVNWVSYTNHKVRFNIIMTRKNPGWTINYEHIMHNLGMVSEWSVQLFS